MRKLVLAAVAAIIVGGAAYYGVMIVPTQKFRTGLDQAIAKLPPDYKVKYGSAHYSLLSHVAEVTDLSIAGNAGAAFTTTIARVSITRPALDLVDNWNHAAANSGALKPDQALPIADRIAVTGLKFQSDMISGTIGNTTIDRERVYPWALLHPGLPALTDIPKLFSAVLAQQKLQREALEAQQAQAEQGADDQETLQMFKQLQQQQLDSLLPLIRLEAAAVLGLGYDGFDGVNADMTIAQPAFAGMPATTIHASIAKLQQGAIDRGIGGEQTFAQLSEQFDPAGSITVDHGSVGRIVARDTLLRLLDNEPLSLATLDGLSLGGFEMDQVAIQVLDGKSINFASMSLSKIAFNHSFLESGGFSLNGLRQNAADMPDERSKALLKQLHLKTVTLSMGAAFQWDADKKSASLHDVGLKIDELGSLSLSADLANIDPANPAGMAQASLSHGTIRYDDASLIDRLLNAGGKQSKKQLRDMREAFAANILLAFTPQQPDETFAASQKAITDFAADPHVLTIILAPPAPVPLTDLKGLAAQGLPNLVGLLGLSVTANP